LPPVNWRCWPLARSRSQICVGPFSLAVKASHRPSGETTESAESGGTGIASGVEFVHEEDVPIILDGEKTQTLRLRVTFRVDEAFIGVSEKVVTVTSGGDLCGFSFTKGHEYLVYGRRLLNDEVYVSDSSATKWKKDASADLKYLRGLPTAPHGATIHGTVFRYAAPENPKIKEIRPGIPQVGQRVQIHGTSQDYATAVDGHGDFNLSGLPPGRYTVLINADGEVTTYTSSASSSSRMVDVADKGCARLYFWIDPFVKNTSKNSAGP
jgi:hypothetical protein